MILLLVAVALKSTAQELNCKFTVNYSQIQGTSTQVFTTLENALMEFINTRRWTQAQYEVNERIRCSMNLTVKEYNEADGRWKCNRARILGSAACFRLPARIFKPRKCRKK